MIIDNLIENVFQEAVNRLGLEETIIDSIIIIGIILIYMYVTYNFIKASYRREKKKKEVKSIVETGSMSFFFFIIAIVVNLKIGVYPFHNVYVNVICIIVYLLGLATNLLGRYYLGNNWGNNVVIYKDQTLIQNGVYKIVRHPLYASIIWMIYAIGLLKSNYLVLILNTLIFIPFMTYRAKQEEIELEKVFKEYQYYKKNTGMFFPNIIKWIRKGK